MKFFKKCFHFPKSKSNFAFNKISGSSLIFNYNIHFFKVGKFGGRSFSTEMENDLKEFSIETEYPNYQKQFTSPISSQYNKIILEDLRNRNFRSAIKSYKTMLDFGGEPTVFTKNLLLSAYAKLKEHQLAENLFQELQERDESDLITFNIMMGLRGKIKKKKKRLYSFLKFFFFVI
jgi:pentatricopeptide repeat protein